MKTRDFASLTLLAAVALLLSACGGSRSKTDSASAGAPAPAAASGRAIEITADDKMKFSLTEIRAKPGEVLSVTLANVGTMPKFSMGHNWLLLAPDTDLMALANAATTAAAKDYRPAEFASKILAATRLLGPNERDTVTFAAPNKKGSYPFVCSFPGHMQVGMKGALIVE